MSDESIFAAALGKAPGAERRAFLDGACGGDDALRRRVERLLEADDRTAGILERGPDGLTGPHEPPGERPGDRVGPYKLLQQIGEGGMGVVYMAEQTRAGPPPRRAQDHQARHGQPPGHRPLRGRAAGAGDDGPPEHRPGPRRRHDRERPALLRHGAGPRRARSPSSATTATSPRASGWRCSSPSARRSSTRHQKGIIHRDIKPSNVLVTMYDDKPVPKVIDFGVAKAIEQRLTERTMFTQFGALVGTFEYMSPEQAEMNAFGVDTRSDVYSLGVLLYELLTGTTPLESRSGCGRRRCDELVRLIKEEEAPRPSVRLSSSGPAAEGRGGAAGPSRGGCRGWCGASWTGS